MKDLSRKRVWVVMASVVAGAGFLVTGIWLVRARGEATGGMPGGIGRGWNENWVRAVHGPVLAVAGSAGDSPRYVGTDRGLYQWQQGSRSWKRIFSAGLWGKPVQAIWMPPGQERRVWIAADSQIYSSGDGGNRWEPGMLVPSPVLCGAVDPRHNARLLIGTTEGLYESLDGGKTSHRVMGLPAQGRFSGVLFDPVRPGLCLALSDQGLFRSEDAGQSWTRVTGLPLGGVEQSGDGIDRLSEERADGEPPGEVLPTTGAEPLQPKLTMDPVGGDLYVSTGQGIFRSLDTGWEWAPLPTDGLEKGREASRITVSPDHPGSLFVLDGSQLYSFHSAEKRWEEVGVGLPQGVIYDVQWSQAGNTLWAGTEAGLFRLNPPKGGVEADAWDRLEPQRAAISKTEPSIQQVQKVAIAYAEVGPEKIRRWRGLASWSAWVPSFTLGLKQNQDANIVSSTKAGITNFSIGPNQQSRSVDFGFTWNLADFVWSSHQTNIDARSRLTVQLRQSLLEEVTRLYFERQRLMAEFEAQPVHDPALRKERALRVQELTAYLDALTGGWFSQHLE